MQNSKPIPKDCQLQVLYDGAEELTLREKIRHWLLRIGTARERRVERLKGMIGRESAQGCAREQQAPDEAAEATGPVSRQKFRAGDVVRVKSFEEISRLFDGPNQTQGLTFMPGMKRFCGKEMRVLKQVQAIFDERAWRMLKIRNAYILENAICDSRGLYEREGCDRCCFFFWKDAWLERVEK